MNKYLALIIFLNAYISLHSMQQEGELLPSCADAFLTLIDSKGNHYSLLQTAIHDAQLLNTIIEDNPDEPVTFENIQPQTMQRFIARLQLLAENKDHILTRRLRAESLPLLLEDAYTAHFMGAATLLNKIAHEIAAKIYAQAHNKLQDLPFWKKIFRINTLTNLIMQHIDTIRSICIRSLIKQMYPEVLLRYPCLWEIESVEYHPYGAHVLAHSYDNTLVACVDPNNSSNCLISDARMFSSLFSDPIRRIVRTPSKIIAAQFSYNNKNIAFVLANGSMLMVTRDASSPPLAVTFLSNNGESISAVAWSHDDNMIIMGGTMGSLCIADIITRRPLQIFMMPASVCVSALSWSPDNQQIAIGNKIGQICCMTQILKYPLKEEFTQLIPHTDAICAIGWSSDNKKLITASKNEMIIRDLTTQEQSIPINVNCLDTLNAIQYAPDNRRIVVSSDVQNMIFYQPLLENLIKKINNSR